MKSKKILIIAFALVLVFGISGSATAAGAPGKIAFVGFNADGLDGFSFVLLSGATAGAVVNFTDNEWDGSVFNTGEGVITWTAPGSVLPAGTVVTIEAGAVVGTGKGSITASSGSLNLGASDENLYAYQGDFSNPTVFLAAISNEIFGSTSVGVITNTGLSVGTTAVQFEDDQDVMVYTGSTTFADEAAALAAIGNTANWITQDGSGDQSQDATAPDFPDDVAAAFVITSPTPITLASFAGHTVNNLPIWASLFAIALLGGAFALRRKNA